MEIDQAVLPRFLALDFALLLGLFLVIYLRARREIPESTVSAFSIVALLVLFGGIFWIQGRVKKQIGPKRFACIACGKALYSNTSQSGIPSCQRTLSCASCGASQISL